MKKISQKEAFAIASSYQFDTEQILLGPWTSYSLLNDPKHMCFVLARYKFCAKILAGKKDILEVGCGDAFGIPIVAQDASYVLGIDVDDRLILDNSRRLNKIKNIEFAKIDICKTIPKRRFDAVYSIDVIEHLDPPIEKKFMQNTIKCMKDDGVCIIGTPNLTAAPYATERSAIQHINLKDAKTMKALLDKYFANSFVFSMNDEVVHTGYYPMAHYLFGVGVGLK